MSTGRSSAPAPPSPGPSGASILTIGRISATTPWWPTSRRPATSCDSRTARGNVHDSKQSAAFLRELIVAVRARLGRSLPLEFRMDAAFFQRDVLRLLAARSCAYAIKVGYWSWLPLKQLAAERQQWHALAPAVTGFEHQLVIPQWNLRLRVMIYRKHVQHDTGVVPRRRSRKRTYTYVLRSMRTLRFTLVARAGRLARIG